MTDRRKGPRRPRTRNEESEPTIEDNGTQWSPQFLEVLQHVMQLANDGPQPSVVP